MNRMLRLAWWRAGLTLCVCCLMMLGLVRPSAALDPQIEPDVVARQVLVVLDPRLTTVHAAAIARRDPSIAVQNIVSALGPSVQIQRVLMQDFVADLDLIRQQNPLAPEVLLSEYFVVTYPDGTDMAQAVARLKSNSLVLSAERNSLLQLASTYYLDQNVYSSPGTYEWGLTSTSPLTFPSAWSRIIGNAYIAAVDNGIYWQNNTTHPDLQTNFRWHFSRHVVFFNTYQQFYPFDSQLNEPSGFPGHGTHMSGLIAATPQGSVGMKGACPGCSFIMMRVTSDSGYLDDPTTAASITEAVKDGAQVINLSLGTAAYDFFGNSYRPPDYCQSNPSTLICTALFTAMNRGVSLVAASGNSKTGLQFPANQANIISAGGLQKDPSSGTISFWTTGYITQWPDYFPDGQTPDPFAGQPVDPCPNTGAKAFGVEGSGSNCSDSADVTLSRFHVVAPAKDVLSTFYYGATHNSDIHCGDRYDPIKPGDPGNNNYLNTGYGDCTGTSMAAPIVSGIVGLIRSANPLLSDLDATTVLRRRASGAGSVIDAYLGYGIPSANDSVIAALSGASVTNPNAYDPNIKNRTTPLFGMYSSIARNHVFTSVPQMAVAGYNGTIKPSPKYKMSNNGTYTSSCSGQSCYGTQVVPSPAINVLKQDNTNAQENVPVLITATGYVVTPNPDYVQSDTSGNVDPAMTWLTQSSTTLTATLLADSPLYYSMVGNRISGYTYFPSIPYVGAEARSTVSVYTSYVNPLGSGPNLVPLYRLSWRCGDYSNPICDNGTNPFHISHVYTTDATEKQSLLSAGYKLDGIEGYVFPTSYSNAPQSGMVRLCRLYDSNADELILFPGTGTNGKNCYPPFPSYAPNSYYSSNRFSTNWLGWVYANYYGGTPPTVSITSPTNGQQFNVGSSVTLKASASGNVQSVAYYANGVFLGSKTSSPYQKNWTVNAAGTYTIYAVATQVSTGLATTSAPITITVGNAPPPFSNSGFETPVVGNGNWQWAPAGASWAFDGASPTGGSGISGNGSGFTYANPNAPEGVQVAFIQGAHAISQVVNFTSTGTYHVQFYAAQRGINGSLLQLQLLVDGINVGTQYPGIGVTSYGSYPSSSFSINTAGSHTITFQGVNNDGLDNSMFIDNVTISSP